MKRYFWWVPILLAICLQSKAAYTPVGGTNRLYFNYTSDADANWVEVAADKVLNRMRVSSGKAGATKPVIPLLISASNSALHLFIQTNGNIGILTNNPQVPLHVHGSIRGITNINAGYSLTVTPPVGYDNITFDVKHTNGVSVVYVSNGVFYVNGVPYSSASGSTNMPYLWIGTNQFMHVSISSNVSGTIPVIFTNAAIQYLKAMGAMTFSGEPPPSFDNDSATVSFLIDANGTNRTLAFDSDWKWLGIKPTNLLAGNFGFLTCLSYSNQVTNVFAAYNSTDSTNLYEVIGGGSGTYGVTNGAFITVTTNLVGTTTVFTVSLDTSITNGFVDASITNGFVDASITNGFVDASITNGFVDASITNGFVDASITNGFVDTSVTNGLWLAITNIRGSNMGGGYMGIYDTTTAGVLQFNMLDEGFGIQLSSNWNLITIATTPALTNDLWFAITNITNMSAVFGGPVTLMTNLNVGGNVYLTNAAYSSASSASNGPAGNEIPTAGWVRSLFEGSGYLYYVTTNITSFTNTDSTTFVYSYGTSVPWPTSRTYSAVSAGDYIGSVATTNKFSYLQGPVVVNTYMGISSSVGGKSATLKAEIYYSYDGTNWLGDWDCAAQNVTTGSNLYQFVVSVPATMSTNSTGFYIERRMKVVTATGTPTPDVTIYLGTNTPSHISFTGPSSLSVTTNTSYNTNIVWMAVIPGGGPGIGTIDNPYNCWGSNKMMAAFAFDTNMYLLMERTNRGTHNLDIRLAPGDYYTCGYTWHWFSGWTPTNCRPWRYRSGMHLSGSGMHNTTLTKYQHPTNVINDTYHWVLYPYSTTTSSNVVIRDMTIDCGASNVVVHPTYGAVAHCGIITYGHDISLYRLKFVDWGSVSTMVPPYTSVYKTWIVDLHSDYTAAWDESHNLLIDGCIASDPYPDCQTYTTAFTIDGVTDGVARNAWIKNCMVLIPPGDVRTNDFSAYQIEGATESGVLDCVADGVTKGFVTHFCTNFYQTISRNVFRDVHWGVEYEIIPSIRVGTLIVENNTFELSPTTAGSWPASALRIHCADVPTTYFGTNMIFKNNWIDVLGTDTALPSRAIYMSNFANVIVEGNIIAQGVITNSQAYIIGSCGNVTFCDNKRIGSTNLPYYDGTGAVVLDTCSEHLSVGTGIHNGVTTNIVLSFVPDVYHTIMVSNDFTVLATNYAPGRSMAVKLVPYNVYGTNYAVTTDTSWQRYGDNYTNAVITLASNKSIILSLTSWDTTRSNVAAAYRQQQ